MLLVAAPALARLLYFALSRIRELAADAVALELIDHPIVAFDSLPTHGRFLGVRHAGGKSCERFIVG